MDRVRLLSINIAVAIFLSMNLFGCLTTRKIMVAPEYKALEETITRFWEARVSQDFETMYDMHTPLFTDKVKYDDYYKRAKGGIVGTVEKFKIEHIELSEDGKSARSAVLKTFIIYFLYGVEHRTDIIDYQQWIMDEQSGTWYIDEDAKDFKPGKKQDEGSAPSFMEIFDIPSR